MLSVVLTEMGRPLPARLTVVPLVGLSLFWTSQSKLILDHPFCGNSFIRRRELYDFSSRNVFITTAIKVHVYYIRYE